MLSTYLMIACIVGGLFLFFALCCGMFYAWDRDPVDRENAQLMLGIAIIAVVWPLIPVIFLGYGAYGLYLVVKDT